MAYPNLLPTVHMSMLLQIEYVAAQTRLTAEMLFLQAQPISKNPVIYPENTQPVAAQRAVRFYSLYPVQCHQCAD